MMYRAGVILFSVVAGAAMGAFVFKMVGEQRIGGELKTLAARFGIQSRPGDNSALSALERVAPGTEDGFKSAIVGTVIASTIAATATTILVREVAG